jgi:hypothetical protein
MADNDREWQQGEGGGLAPQWMVDSHSCHSSGRPAKPHVLSKAAAEAVQTALEVDLTATAAATTACIHTSLEAAAGIRGKSSSLTSDRSTWHVPRAMVCGRVNTAVMTHERSWGHAVGVGGITLHLPANLLLVGTEWLSMHVGHVCLLGRAACRILVPLLPCSDGTGDKTGTVRMDGIECRAVCDEHSNCIHLIVLSAVTGLTSCRDTMHG